MPRRPKSAAQAAAAGSGWRPLVPVFAAEGAAGAARFASGKGRHGDFGDL